jgi:transcription initiation factor IIE alpha subunit
MLSRLKFKCEKCGEKVDYDSVEKYMEVCDKDNINNIKKKKKRAVTN